jgi:hypothetical protein
VAPFIGVPSGFATLAVRVAGAPGLTVETAVVPVELVRERLIVGPFTLPPLSGCKVPPLSPPLTQPDTREITEMAVASERRIDDFILMIPMTMSDEFNTARAV